MYKKKEEKEKRKILMLDENYKHFKNKTTTNQLNIQKYILYKEWKITCILNQHIQHCLESTSQVIVTVL